MGQLHKAISIPDLTFKRHHALREDIKPFAFIKFYMIKLETI